MLTLTTHNGRPVLLIPRPKGEPKRYYFRLHIDGEAWSVDLEQDDGPEYTVWLGSNGQQQCSCAAYEYSKTHPHNCKHCRLCQELREVLTAVFHTQPEEAGAKW